MKKKYYHVHVNYGKGNNGYSVYFEASFPEEPNLDDIAGRASDIGLINIDDIICVDEATEISEREYKRATKIVDIY